MNVYELAKQVYDLQIKIHLSNENSSEHMKLISEYRTASAELKKYKICSVCKGTGGLTSEYSSETLPCYNCGCHGYET